MTEIAFRNVGNNFADPQVSRAGAVVIHWIGRVWGRHSVVIELNLSTSWRIS